jgi:hypothetical protein
MGSSLTRLAPKILISCSPPADGRVLTAGFRVFFDLTAAWSFFFGWAAAFRGFAGWADAFRFFFSLIAGFRVFFALAATWRFFFLFASALPMFNPSFLMTGIRSFSQESSRSLPWYDFSNVQNNPGIRDSD